MALDLFDRELHKFLELCEKHQVRLLMVGGGAVNFHGYQRHSADVDFWLDTSPENFMNLIVVMNKMGYEIDDFPEKVKKKEQNISFKFSPESFTVELITHYSSSLSFEDAWKKSETHKIGKHPVRRFRVISLQDLIDTKLKSGRAKDLLDVNELKKINKSK